MNGDLDASRQRWVESAETYKKAGSPAVKVLASELEALRIDILQGRVSQTLPEMETRLAKLESWWQERRSGQRLPEAPNLAFLARTFIAALDIANDADRAQNDWNSALRRTDAVLDVKRALQCTADDIAETRMNRAVELDALDRYDEAKAELEVCLEVFQNDPARRATVLASLAHVFDKQGHVPHAISQQRRALALREALRDPAARAISHSNLAIHLERSGTPSDPAESPRHQLAALIYHLVAGGAGA
jgi:tetratricopeptide (TPR) repeat protein